MKKVLKFLCLLLIAALIAILVLKNGAKAEDNFPGGVDLSKTTDIEDGETITVTIGLGSGVTSYDGVITVGSGDITIGGDSIFHGGADDSVTKNISISGSGTGSVHVHARVSCGDQQNDYDQNIDVAMKSDEPQPGQSVDIHASVRTFVLGQEVTSSIEAVDGLINTPISVDWSSSNDSVAGVSPANGTSTQVIPRSVGEADIIATLHTDNGDKEARVTISVVEGEDPPPPPSDPLTVTASQGTIYVREGSTTVTANKDVEWLIEGDAATLDNRQARSVTVTPVHEGSVTVTGKAGEETQGVTITVAKRENPPDDDPQPNLTPGKTTLTIGEDQSTTISSDIDIENWSSSDRNVAVIAADSTARQATILPKNAGTTTITATTSKGKSAIVTITVKKNEYAAPVITPSGNIKMEVGTSVSLSANQNVSWSSGNSSIAAVGSSGVVVAKGVGETRITATNTNGKSSSVTITVIQTSNNGGGNNGDGGNGSVTNPDDVNPDVGTVTTTTFAISPTKTQTLNIGDTLQIKVTKGSATSWKSSKPAVASVDNNGKVTANSAGTTIITAVSSDGSVAQVKVRVRDENGEVPDPGSESNNDVPSTGEASTELLLVLGVLTCVIAMFIFRKKTK